MPWDARKVVLEEMRSIDEVFISMDSDGGVCKSLEALKPDIFAKGGDRYAGEIPEAETCRRLNIQIVDGLGEKIRASSKLLKDYSNPHQD